MLYVLSVNMSGKRKRTEGAESGEDDDDAGSLVDFVVKDEDVPEPDGSTVDEEADAVERDDVHEIVQQLPAVANMGTVITDGVRRSTRANKGKPPEQFIPDNFAELMMEGENPDEVFADDEDEGGGDEDSCTDDGGPDTEEEDDDYEEEDDEESEEASETSEHPEPITESV